MTSDEPTQLVPESPNAVLETALSTLLNALRRVGAGQRRAKTSTTDFAVEGLAQHLVDNAVTLAPVIGIRANSRSVKDAEDLEAVVGNALRPLVRRLACLDPNEQLDLGQSVDVLTVVKFLSVEFLVHAWDISRALGTDLHVSDSLARAVHRNCEDVGDSLFFTPDTFSEARSAPQGARPLERLLALTGRDPGGSRL